MKVAHRHGVAIFLGLAVLAIAGVFSLSAIAQDPAYHDFADKRSFLGIPNFGDVMGNLAFAVVGIAGLVRAHHRWPRHKGADFWLWAVFFGGVFLVAFGSGYYHLAPGNATLVWDRLPMTIAFMSLFSIVIRDRMHERWGLLLFPAFLLIGIGSVWYWDWTESLGRGDLRPYALVQFYPVLAIILMIALFPPRHAGTAKYLFWTLGWYIAAKLLEHFDPQIFALTGHVVSGHTLKHVAAAVGVACMVPYMKAGDVGPDRDAKTSTAAQNP